MRIGRRGVTGPATPPYWRVAVPVIDRMDGAEEGVRAGGQGRDVVDRGRDAREDLARRRPTRPTRSLSSTLWGMPGSSFRNAIVNGRSAGAVTLVSRKAIAWAVMVTSAAGAGGAAEPAAHRAPGRLPGGARRGRAGAAGVARRQPAGLQQRRRR